MISRAAIAAITCGVVFGAAGLGTSATLNAQTLASRISGLRNGSATFSYPTRTGVCGDGVSIMIRNSDDPDRVDIMQMRDDGSTNSWNSRTDNLMRNCQPGPAHVRVTAVDGRVTRLVATVGGAAPDGTDFGTATPQEASHALLAIASSTAKTNTVAENAIVSAAISDAVPETTTELLAMTHERSLPTPVRKDAVYYTTISNEPRVTNRLKELLADRNEDNDVRSTALYSLTRHPSPDVVQLLLNTARSSDEKKLKSDAVFWLGQMAGEKATAGLKSILDDDSEEMEVRDAAVFALSNQKSGNAVDLLMDVATKSKEPHLRRTAMFWLGKHSDDPRVLKMFEDILTKN